MKISLKRLNRALFSTQECKEMMHKDFGEIVNEMFLNEDQEQLVEKCSESLQIDEEKEKRIKDILIHQFFNKHKKTHKHQDFVNRNPASQTIDPDFRRSLQTKFKQQLSIVLHSRTQSLTPQLKSNRYGDSSPLDFSFCRPFAPPSMNHPNSSYSKRQKELFSNRIETIIEESNRLKTRRAFTSRQQIKTASDRFRDAKRRDKAEKKTIINKIINNDVEQYLKSFSVQGESINPESKRRAYEQRKRKQISSFDKYNMSFMNYIRQKTNSNIQKSIYNDKIRLKNSYMQKFQQYILEEFKFSDDYKHKLEKVFEGIEMEFKGPSKNRQMRQRAKPR